MEGSVKRFEDLNVWKESMNLTIVLYKSLAECKDFGFRDQIQRSAVSIPSNIAEGRKRSTKKRLSQVFDYCLWIGIRTRNPDRDSKEVTF